MRADPTHCASVRLAGGRRLGYAITGPADGTPVIYCHGAIGTPVGRSVDLETLTAELGVRYIAVNRLGIGASDRAGIGACDRAGRRPIANDAATVPYMELDPQSSPAEGAWRGSSDCAGGRLALGSDRPEPRSVLDFADDVRELCDHLLINKFGVVGVSAGGPYALAVARALPERVERVALCSSLSPLCAPHLIPGMEPRLRFALSAMSRAPRTTVRLGDALLPLIRRRPGLITKVIAAHAARCERARVREPDEQAAAIASFLDATAAGVGGMVDDYLTCCRDWGFHPGGVSAEVHLWHGARDPIVPIEHALQLAIALPRCQIFIDLDEGHHFFRSRLATILAVLIGRDQHPATPLDQARTMTNGGRRVRR